MRSENVITIIFSDDPDKNPVKFLTAKLACRFKVRTLHNLESALAEPSAHPEGLLLYINNSFQSKDFPSSVERKLCARFSSIILYLNHLPSQAQMEMNRFTFVQRDTQDVHHKHLITFINNIDKPEKTVTNKAHDILSAMGDAVISVNDSLRIEYINPTACKLIGTTPKDSIGKKVEHFLDLRSPTSNKKITQQIFSQYQNVQPSSAPLIEQSQYLLLNSLDDKQYKIAARSSTYYTPESGIESVVVLRDISNKPNISHEFPASDNKYWVDISTFTSDQDYFYKIIK